MTQVQKTHFSLLQEAINATYEGKYRDAAWEEYTALLKAANAYNFFWKPINECPKQKGVLYLLAYRSRAPIKIGKWREKAQEWASYSTAIVSQEDPLFYAEIPPLPEKKEAEQ